MRIVFHHHPCNSCICFLDKNQEFGASLEGKNSLILFDPTATETVSSFSMTRREFATLVFCAIYLAKCSFHSSWVFSAGQIYEEVWGEDGENCGTAVASVITGLYIGCRILIMNKEGHMGEN